MSSNVKSNLWLCNLAIPGMAERGGGSVIIVSSIAGLRGNSVIGAYGISKAADFALARNLAVEWGPKNVRVNCIAPGLIKTDFAQRAVGEPGHSQAPDGGDAAAAHRHARRDRAASPCSWHRKAASFITGQVIVADGGVTIADHSSPPPEGGPSASGAGWGSSAAVAPPASLGDPPPFRRARAH